MIESVTGWEPKLREAAVKWMNELDVAIDKNNGNPVAWDYKNLQDRFRQFDCSHNEVLQALNNACLITVTETGGRRHFGLTNSGWTQLVNENYSKLRLLLTDPIARERNRNAIKKREKRRKIYADPTKRIIDEFRHGVKFDYATLLKQLQRDKNTPRALSRKAIKVEGGLRSQMITPIANMRFAHAVRPLVDFETRNFCDLTRNESGKIYHEFTALHLPYRKLTSFNSKPYLMCIDITTAHGTYLRKLTFDFYPALYAHGESLGLYLIYEPDVLSFFGERTDPEFRFKYENVLEFIRKQMAECLMNQTL